MDCWGSELGEFSSLVQLGVGEVEGFVLLLPVPEGELVDQIDLQRVPLLEAVTFVLQRAGIPMRGRVVAQILRQEGRGVSKSEVNSVLFRNQDRFGRDAKTCTYFLKVPS